MKKFIIIFACLLVGCTKHTGESIPVSDNILQESLSASIGNASINQEADECTDILLSVFDDAGYRITVQELENFYQQAGISNFTEKGSIQAWSFEKFAVLYFEEYRSFDLHVFENDIYKGAIENSIYVRKNQDELDKTNAVNFIKHDEITWLVVDHKTGYGMGSMWPLYQYEQSWYSSLFFCPFKLSCCGDVFIGDYPWPSLGTRALPQAI